MQRSGFLFAAARRLTTGPRIYYIWVLVLLVTAIVGIAAYTRQLQQGLIVSGMTSYVSWGLYIGNFTFLVGVAAAAVLLIIPAYLYDFGPIKEVVIVGEALAVSALCMCLMFVTADLGRPDRVWHLIPGLGILNLPRSLLGWDIVVLNGYLFLNLFIPGYLLWNAYHQKPENTNFILPFILLSIPWAVSIHTVTAFIYNGLVARPFWNASILAPRFLASAFCSGPALVILLYQIVRKYTQISRQRRSALQNRGDDLDRDGGQSVLAWSGILQGTLFGHPSSVPFEIPLCRPSRQRGAYPVDMDCFHIQHHCILHFSHTGYPQEFRNSQRGVRSHHSGYLDRKRDGPDHSGIYPCAIRRGLGVPADKDRNPRDPWGYGLSDCSYSP